jgi:aldehyde dehydrogenase (NAD+)
VSTEIHDVFVRELIARMTAMKVGDALDPATTVGPVIDEAQLERNLNYLDTARQEGATVIGGKRPETITPGHYLAPALITDSHNDMQVNRDEIFGPIASIIRVKDADEALFVANQTEFGLSAGICTTSLRNATRFKRELQAGMVMVNAPTAGVDYHVPFGGSKSSSYGPREQGAAAREMYSVTKTAYTYA